IRDYRAGCHRVPRAILVVILTDMSDFDDQKRAPNAPCRRRRKPRGMHAARSAGAVDAGSQDGEAERRAGAAGRRDPASVWISHEPSEAAPHGPVVLLERVDDESVAAQGADDF